MDNVQKHKNFITPIGWLRASVADHPFYIPIPFPIVGLLFYHEDGSSRFRRNVTFHSNCNGKDLLPESSWSAETLAVTQGGVSPHGIDNLMSEIVAWCIWMIFNVVIWVLFLLQLL
jgi:hypothetical protein